MKAIYLLTAFTFLLSHSSKAQSIGDISLSEIKSEYIELHILGLIGKKGMQVGIDFGQENEPLSLKDQLLVNEKGKAMAFNSKMDVLNFMFENGYELEQIYVIPTETSGNDYYVMKRKKE